MVDGPRAGSPREYLRHVDERWKDISERVLGPEARLIAVSRYLCDSRVYAANGRVAKIRCKPAPGEEAYISLATEAEILDVTGRTAEYGTHQDWEYVVQDRIDGTTFSAHCSSSRKPSTG